MKRKFIKIVPFFIGLMLIAFATVGLTYAYLSRSPGEVKNTFTVGSVKIQLLEDNWNPNNAKELHPNQEFTKDPKVRNTGDNNAFVFLEVYVPMDNISLVDNKGALKLKGDKVNQELFTFDANTTNWSLVKREDVSGYRKYVYSYNNVVKPGEYTSNLFTKVKTVNYVEYLNSTKSYNLKVIAKAIQSDGNTISKETMTNIYNSSLANLN